jgi:hypothetical protein
MTKKRLLLLALPLAMALTLGVLAMLQPRPGVTKANFDRIQEGMSMAEVEQILGGRSGRKTYWTVGETTTITEVWRQIEQGECVGSANIKFQGELVVDKDWQRFSETILNKILGLIHLR